MVYVMKKNNLWMQCAPRGEWFQNTSELESSEEFDLPACGRPLRDPEELVLNVGCRVRIPVCDGKKLQLVESVVEVCLEAKEHVAIQRVESELLGGAHIDVEVTRTLEAIAPDARCICKGWR